MHPDFKTFSEISGFKPRLEIRIVLKKHGEVKGTVAFNNVDVSEGENIFNAGMYEDLIIQSTISDFKEGTSGFEITDFTVNGYNVIPIYQHYSSSGNAYHDWIGKWNMVIPGPFYAWYHNASGQGWIA